MLEVAPDSNTTQDAGFQPIQLTIQHVVLLKSPVEYSKVVAQVTRIVWRIWNAQITTVVWIWMACIAAKHQEENQVYKLDAWHNFTYII